MSQTRIGNRKKWIRLTLAVVATMLFLPTVAAYAETITYTFSGDGAGTINGNAFSGDFSFVFTSDTSDVAPFGSEYINQTLAGTFTEDSNIVHGGRHLRHHREPRSGFSPRRFLQPHHIQRVWSSRQRPHRI